MKRLALSLALCLAVSPLWGQATAVIVGPAESTPGDLIVLDASESDAAAYSWTLVGSKKTFLPVDGGLKVVFASGDAGVYVFVLSTAKADTVAVAIHEVTIGTPIPPTPTPPVPPGPGPGPQPPVPAGQRELILFRESADDTPPQGQMYVALRSGPAADYLKSKGHELWILDVDAVDGSGQPPAIVKDWKPQLSGMTLPVLVVIDKSGPAPVLVSKSTLPADATADTVLDLVKKAGG